MHHATTSTDPVCGMTVTRESAAATIVHDGTEYLFCSEHCADNFRADPERFVTSGDPGKPHPAASHSCCSHKHSDHASQRHEGPKDAVYTCPMHPEVRQIGPGDCPKCGMALEPLDPTAAHDDTELRDMTRRFWVATSLRRCSYM
jgi:Cu+-exporting ATPase